MNGYIHIVCFDAPSPPDYGGGIDLFYKVKALHELGQKIILHYFDYKSGRNANGLEDYCKAIYKYKRNTGWKGISFTQPYIVASRSNKELINRLNEDDYPVLLEGIHCTGIIPFLKNKKRKIIVRMHNDEALYYRYLSKLETSFLKKQYYKLESILLKKYQANLPPNLTYACISTKDMQTLHKNYGLKNLHFIPAFLPWQEVQSLEGIGSYCLYHGNMQVAENKRTAEWLIDAVFSTITLPLIIAGKGIPEKLIRKAASYPHIRFHPDPNTEEVDDWIQNAHVNILPSFNNTGVKLKLLHALFYGRFCITNTAGITGTDLAQVAAIANTPQEIIDRIYSYFLQPFSMQHIEDRKAAMARYNNHISAQQLSALC